MNQNETHKTWIERLGGALLREPQTQEQLVTLLHDAKDRELIDPNTLSMIEAILGFSELQARDVMIPRGQMAVIQYDATASQALPLVIESGHSRFPVINETHDEIVGILLAKDLLPLFFKQQVDTVTIAELIRPTTFVPESKRLDALLKDFRQKRNHMAVVINEYGGVSGLVTIEDVLEQIVGDIIDETDLTEEEPDISPLSENEYLVKALIPIEDFNDQFHTQFNTEDTETYDTLGGMLIQHFGYLPLPGERVRLGDFEFTVVGADSRRLSQIRVLHHAQRPHE